MATTTVRIPYPRRRWPVVAIGILVAGFLALTFLSNFYVDVLWYREVDLSQVFWTRIWAQAGLASAFFVTFFALLLVNLYVTRRLAPTIVALTPEQEIVERFKENVEPYLRWAIRSEPRSCRSSSASPPPGTGRSSCSGGPPAGSRSGTPTRSSAATPRSTSSRFPG